MSVGDFCCAIKKITFTFWSNILDFHEYHIFRSYSLLKVPEESWLSLCTNKSTNFFFSNEKETFTRQIEPSFASFFWFF